MRPTAPVAAHWSTSDWRLAHPADDAPRGPWWTMYGDPGLDQLEAQAERDNPGLQAALARVRQAQALSQIAQSALAPQLTAAAGATRTRTSVNRPLANPAVGNLSTTQNDFTPALSARWEADLGGGLQRGVEAAQAQAQQTMADAQTTRLLLSANLASTYLGARALEVDLEQLEQLIAEQERTLSLERHRAALGQATALALIAPQAALDASRVQLASLRSQRGALLSALAVLSGTPAPDFRLPAGGLPERVPQAPLGLPADLLERRPDIAAAERSVAQANALIGVAGAARYPTLTLGASGGSESRLLERLFQAPSLIWALGGSVAQTLYDGGKIGASVAAAQAAREVAVARYRDTVLAALGEVEAAISSEQALALAAEGEQAACATALTQLRLTRKRHDGGLGAAAELVAAEQAVTLAERSRTQLHSQRLLNSVFLVKALGGAWPPSAKIGD